MAALAVFLFVFALILILVWLVYGMAQRRHKKATKYVCINCGSDKMSLVDGYGPALIKCDSCGEAFSDPVELFALEQAVDGKDPDDTTKDRICPECGSDKIYPDQVAGSLITWTCSKCGSTFPSAIEIYQKTKK